MGSLIQDVRYGFRSLLKRPGFTAIVVVTLALGIGANTAIFSVVNALLLKALPYQRSEQLVWIEEVSPQSEEDVIPGAHFLEWSEQSRTIERIAVFSAGNQTLTGAGEVERLNCGKVSSGFFSMFGVQPVLGRDFLNEEDRPGANSVAIITHNLWQRRFNTDRNIVGHSISLDNETYTVVGVLPPDFRFFQSLDVFVPLALDSQQERGNQMISMLSAIARLKPGITNLEAEAELETIRSRFESGKPANTPLFGGQVRIVSLHQKLVGNTQRLLLILLGAVSLTLLIACTNVANLLLSSAVTRQKEFAIRAGLGAGRIRLVRQMLTESLLLALSGGLLGLLVAFWLKQGLVALAVTNPIGNLSHLINVSIDGRVLGFTLVVSALIGILFGLVPALQLSRPNLSDWLKEGSRGTSSYRSRVRSLLIATEVALAMVLLVGAGLLIRSFVKLVEVDPGYSSKNLLTMRISLPQLGYEQGTKRAEFYREVLQRVASLPGVDSVGGINHLPLTSIMFSGSLRIPVSPHAQNKNRPSTPIGVVTNDYFRAMQMPLRAGRVFNEFDRADSPRVVILSGALARELFPNEEPIGKQLWLPGAGKGMATVVGIVGDVRQQGLDEDITPQVYVPYLQQAHGSMVLVVRTKTDPLALTGPIRNEVQAIDPNLPVYEILTMDQRLGLSVSPRRFNLLLLGSFALLALALSAVGVYSVVAYLVTQRTHEIGIRMAIGAQRSDVLTLLIRQGMASVLIGVGVGLAGAFVLTRLITALLFGVSPSDAATFVAASILLVAVALVACYVPARRATKVDPLVALRYE